MKKQIIATIAAISVSYLTLSTVAHADHKAARMDQASQHASRHAQNMQADHTDAHGHHTHINR